MKYLSLVYAGLRRKPFRTILTFLSIVVAFMLFGVLATAESSVRNIFEMERRDRMGVETRYGGRFRHPLPASYRERIARVPGVRAVSPRANMSGFWQNQRNNISIGFITPDHAEVYPDLTLTRGLLQEMEKKRTGLIVSAAWARQRGWKVGDRIPVTSRIPQRDGSMVWTFDIVAIADNRDRPGEDTFAFGSYRYFDEARATGKGTVDNYMVRLTDERRKAEIAQTIDAMFLNSATPTRSGGGDRNGLEPDDVTFFVRYVVGGVLFMILFITGNTMMQSIRERVPEFAVLKTIGFSDQGVLALVLAEAVLLCMAAGLVGLGISNLLARMLASLLPNAPASLMQMPWSAVGIGLCFALLTALLSSLIPAIRMKRLNIVDALAGR